MWVAQGSMQSSGASEKRDNKRSLKTNGMTKLVNQKRNEQSFGNRKLFEITAGVNYQQQYLKVKGRSEVVKFYCISYTRPTE